jgi:hypothetical protein
VSAALLVFGYGLVVAWCLPALLTRLTAAGFSARLGLAAAFPGVPLFTRGPAEVARLAEMCADDAAARHSSRPMLVTALLAMGTGTAVRAAALAATGGTMAAQVQRLVEPAPRARHTRNRLALVTVIILLALVSGLVTRYAGPLATHGLAVV